MIPFPLTSPGGRGKGVIIFSSFLAICLIAAACIHLPENLSEPERVSRIFDADEKIIIRAITQVLKDRGLGEPKVEADKGFLETEYKTEGNWRTKIEAGVKKISRREREVTLAVITEKKSSSGWLLKKIMGKEQYDAIFEEIEMQIYHEWYKGGID